MDLFEYRAGRLFCEELPVADLARQFGTPLYLYSAGTLRRHYRKLAEAFAPVAPLLCYSVKVCSNIHILSLLKDEGAGFAPPAAFQTGGPKGGYGIFSIRERLDLLGGRIDIRSRPGKGSRFTLLAPLGPADAAGPLPPPETDPAQEHSEAGAAAPAARKIRVLLSDAHAVVRQSMAHALSAEPDMEVVAEADDDAAALEMARASAPDVAILEVGETNRCGLKTIRRFRAELPHVRLIGLSLFEDERLGKAVLAAGAAKYLCQTGPSAALVAAVRECGRNGRAKEDPPPDGGQKPKPDPPPKRGKRSNNGGGEKYAGD